MVNSKIREFWEPNRGEGPWSAKKGPRQSRNGGAKSSARNRHTGPPISFQQQRYCAAACFVNKAGEPVVLVADYDDQGVHFFIFL